MGVEAAVGVHVDDLGHGVLPLAHQNAGVGGHRGLFDLVTAPLTALHGQHVGVHVGVDQGVQAVQQVAHSLYLGQRIAHVDHVARDAAVGHAGEVGLVAVHPGDAGVGSVESLVQLEEGQVIDTQIGLHQHAAGVGGVAGGVVSDDGVYAGGGGQLDHALGHGHADGDLLDLHLRVAPHQAGQFHAALSGDVGGLDDHPGILAGGPVGGAFDAAAVGQVVKGLKDILYLCHSRFSSPFSRSFGLASH